MKQNIIIIPRTMTDDNPNSTTIRESLMMNGECDEYVKKRWISQRMEEMMQKTYISAMKKTK